MRQLHLTTAHHVQNVLYPVGELPNLFEVQQTGAAFDGMGCAENPGHELGVVLCAPFLDIQQIGFNIRQIRLRVLHEHLQQAVVHISP